MRVVFLSVFLTFAFGVPVKAGMVPVGQNSASYTVSFAPNESVTSSETIDLSADVANSGDDGETVTVGRAQSGGYLDTPPFALVQAEASARGKAGAERMVSASLSMTARTQWFVQPVYTGVIPLDPDVVYEIPFVVDGFWEISLALGGNASGRASVSYPERQGAGGTSFRQVQATNSPASEPEPLADSGKFEAPFSAICPGDIGCIPILIGITAEIDIGVSALETLYGGSANATALVDPIAYIDPSFAFVDDWTVLISENLLAVGPDIVFPDPPVDPDPPIRVSAPGSTLLAFLSLSTVCFVRRRKAL